MVVSQALLVLLELVSAAGLVPVPELAWASVLVSGLVWELALVLDLDQALRL